MFMFLFGLLQFWIEAGELPFNPDSTYGLLLVIISIQIITLGKTPFGSFRRTLALFILGIGTAVLGTMACFIPGFLEETIRFLVGIILFAGGIILFLQLITSREKAKHWIRIPGILRHLTIACGFAYLMEVLFGFHILFPDHSISSYAGLLSLVFGISFFYLAWCMQNVFRIYPPKIPQLGSLSSLLHSTKMKALFFLFRETAIHTHVSFIILLGVIFTFFAILLIPVTLGILPFARDSQFGLLMVIMAVQVLAMGKTPLGIYKRSPVLMAIGLGIESIGIYACIVPGLLTGWMLLPLGIWNLITGTTGLTKLCLPLLHEKQKPSPEPVQRSSIIKKLQVTAGLLYLATILFGINLIIPGLIPGLAVLVILFFLGFLFFILAYIQMHLPAGGTDRIS